jgi:hypothetical protein
MRRQIDPPREQGGDGRAIIGFRKPVQTMFAVLFSLLYVRRWGLDWAETAMLVPDASKMMN